MHRLLRNVCLILCWLMAIPVSAQRIISGTVFDENKEPLMGATVSVKEKVTLGTTTDTQGKYTLKLPDNREYTLQVSCLRSALLKFNKQNHHGQKVPPFSSF